VSVQAVQPDFKAIAYARGKELHMLVDFGSPDDRNVKVKSLRGVGCLGIRILGE